MPLQRPLAPHDSRPFRLYHDRENGINYLSCLIHGRQTGPISQLQAEMGQHAEIALLLEFITNSKRGITR